MAIDASIPLQAKPNVALQNPFELAQQAGTIQNLYNQNKLFQSQQAAGSALQSAIDPQTGKLDIPTAQRNLLQAGPAAAMSVPGELSRTQGLAGAQQNRSADAQALVNQGIVSLAALPDAQLNGDAIRQKISSMTQAGVLTPQDAQAAVSDLPPDGAGTDAYRSYVLRHLVQNLAGPQQAQTIYGSQNVVANGQTVRGAVQASPAFGGGITPNGPAIPVYPSRSELMGRVQTGVDQNGAPIYGPASAVTPPNLAGPAADSQFPNGGRLPPALRGPGAQATPPVPNGGNVVTGVGPAQQAQMSTTGAQSATAFQNIADQGVQAKSQGAILDNMLADTSQFSTGPGQDWLKTKAAVLQRFAPGLAKTFGVTPESLAANESFDKFANQLANAQGAGSDARMAVNQGANPSSHLTPAGADFILRQLRGNTDYLGARAQLAASYPDKANRAGFEASVGANLDPRVFQYARMTPEQKGTFLTSMKGGTGPFKKAYHWTEQQGLLNAGQ